MNTSFKRTTVTAALPYTNGPKHIGHLAGAYLPADIYVRYLRNKGHDVVFICGSDEHGAAITIQALKEKTTPRAIIDKYHVLVRDCFEKLGISFDIYHRTSEPIHHQTAQQFFLHLHERNLLELEESEQYFDEEANVFLADRYIIGTCPNCKNENAYGDQCEKCGSSLSPKELINPHSTLSGKAPVLRKTSHWNLPLDKYEPFLRKWILQDHKDDWRTSVYGQCKSWIDGGLHARAVTRDLDWGVKVPLPNADGKVLYVWFDAPIGYISATRQWATDNGKNWELYWKDKDTRLVHFVGKDNIVFHCIIFPVMLHAHGGYILPDNVPANEFLNLEGDKMSTSRSWSVEMHDYLHEFPGKEDVLRYYLTSIAPETKDSDFTWKGFQFANNSELVAILGNFVNRVMVLTQKFYQGVVPVAGEETDIELKLKADFEGTLQRSNDKMEHFHFRDAQAEVMNLARLGNKYLAETEPWKLVKTDTLRIATILHTSIQITAQLAYVIEPFLPFTSAKIFEQLNLVKQNVAIGFDLVKPGHLLAEPKLLFNQIEDDIIQTQIDKLNAAVAKRDQPTTKIKPMKSEIAYDDFAKMDLRMGTILEAEKVKGADKLLKLLIDIGLDKRTVVSGIAMHFSAEEIIGQQVLLLANLAPRKLRGIESQGMILMAETPEGKLRFVQPSEKLDNGSSVQ